MPRTFAHFGSDPAHAQAEAESAKSFLAVWNRPKIVLQTLGKPASRLQSLDRQLKVQFRIEIRYDFHFVIEFQLLADFCDNHKKYVVNLHALYSGFNVFLVLCKICEKRARRYFDLRCAVRDGGHSYICNLCVPRY